MADEIEIYPRLIFGKTALDEQKVLLVDANGRPICVSAVQQTTLHSSAAETASVTGSDVDIEPLKAADFYLDVTAIAGDATQTLDVKIQEKDPVSGKYFDLVSFTQVTTTTTSERKNYGSGAGELLGKTIRYVATIAGGGAAVSFTFSLSMVGKA